MRVSARKGQVFTLMYTMCLTSTSRMRRQAPASIQRITHSVRVLTRVPHACLVWCGLQVNPDALPAPPGPQFKVQVNPAAGAAAAAGNAAAGAAAAGTAASAAAGALGASAKQAAAGKPAGGSKASGGAGAAAGKAAGSSKAGATDKANPFYVEQASHAQPPLLQSLKPSAGG